MLKLTLKTTGNFQGRSEEALNVLKWIYEKNTSLSGDSFHIKSLAVEGSKSPNAAIEPKGW